MLELYNAGRRMEILREKGRLQKGVPLCPHKTENALRRSTDRMRQRAHILSTQGLLTILQRATPANFCILASVLGRL